MKVGITATRKGLTVAQMLWANRYIQSWDIVHHGDCKGGDAQLHDIAHSKGCKIIIHPGNLPDQRAYKESDVVLMERPPLERNQDIVNEVEVLLAFPSSDKELLRSGTWATVRYARKVGLTMHIIYPDGHVVKRRADMHDELDAMGGTIVANSDPSIPYRFMVELNGVEIGSYNPEDSRWRTFVACPGSWEPGKQKEFGLPSERAAVDWLIAQYFLGRSSMQTVYGNVPKAYDPEPPEFPTYVGWDGKEHEVF